MGYNNADHEVVKRGQFHFQVTPDTLGERDICVPQVEITRQGGFHQDAEILSSTLEAMYRYHSDGPITTVWLCIAPEFEEVPGYVAPALERLVAFGIGSSSPTAICAPTMEASRAIYRTIESGSARRRRLESPGRQTCAGRDRRKPLISLWAPRRARAMCMARGNFRRFRRTPPVWADLPLTARRKRPVNPP